MLMKYAVFSAAMGVALVSFSLISGCGGSSKSANGAPPPSFAPGGGAYNSSQTVTVTDTMPGAVLYCTTDGSTPTTTSPRCAEPTTVYQTEFLQAIAVAPGQASSAVAAAAYTINLNAVATPTFSPAGGTYTGPQQVTIADATSGANVYYTLDGSVPAASSPLYTGPIHVSSSETVSAVAVASGYSNSGVASAAYAINQVVAAPVFSISTGSYTTTQTVTITDQTAGAVIYYSLNGPVTTSSTVYSSPVSVVKTETLSAIAVLNGISSTVTTAAYAISSNPAVPAPAFFPASGSSFTLGQESITISDLDTNATIHYTLDGSTASGSSPAYSGPIPLTTAGTVTIQAIAVDAGANSSSAVARATYTVTTATGVPEPTFSPASGSAVTVGQTVELADSDTNAAVHFTTDGTTPTANSSVYSAPIALTTAGAITIQAIAIDSGNASPVATATYSVAPAGATLTGKVLSGKAPVNGTSVQLYSAGSSGYGSSGAPVGSAVNTDKTGAFTITYGTCPASPNDLLYLVASGGDAGSGANSSLRLMTALGPCSGLTSGGPVVINEATTVASAYSLSAFMTTAPGVGVSSTNYQGLSNSFATANNLVNPATGAVLSITPAYAANPVPFLNSSTVPQSRIDTLADILNSCDVSSGGGACSSLFSAATPSGGTAPADTLQAILNVAQNPGLNVSTLFGLASVSGPFQPELSGAPNDWTIALTYTGAGLGLSPTTVGKYTSGSKTYTGVGPIINTGMAIDASGNIWVAAFGEDNQSSPAPSTGNGIRTILAGFNSLGAPITAATSVSADSSQNVAFGGYDPEPGNAVALDGSMAIDTSGNIWLGDQNPLAASQSSILAVGPTGTVVLPPAQNVATVSSLAFDTVGNIWATTPNGVAEYAYSSSNQSLSQLLSNTTSLSSYAGALTFDSNGIPWVTQIDDSFTQASLFALDPGNGNILYDPFSSIPGSTFTPLVADGSGNIYGCDPSVFNLDVLNYNTSAQSGSILFTYPIPDTGRGCGTTGSWMILDGQGRIFVVLNTYNGFPSGVNIDEYSTAGVLLSPAANGYTGTSAGESETISSDANYTPSLISPIAAMDSSGNLWVLNVDTTGTDFSGNPHPGNVLVEYVGIGAPVVTPTSTALKNGQLAARP